MTPRAPSPQPTFLSIARDSVRRRVRLVPVWVALSAAAAYFIGQTLGRDTWEAQGVLRFGPPPVGAGMEHVYKPPNGDAISQAFTSPELLDAAARQAGSADSGKKLAGRVATEIPPNSNLIRVSLEGPDRDEVTRILDAALNRVIDEQAALWGGQLDDSITALDDGLREARRDRDEALQRQRDMLAGTDTDDPAGELAMAEADVRALTNEIEAAQREEKQLQAQIDLADREIAKEAEDAPGGLTPAELDRRARELELEGVLKDVETDLRGLTAERNRISRGVRDGVIPRNELTEIEGNIEKAARLRETTREQLKLVRTPPAGGAEKSPSELRRDQLQSELLGVGVKIDQAKAALGEKVRERDRLRKLMDDFGPIIQRADRLRRTVEEREAALAGLRTMRDTGSLGLSVATPASPGDTPASSSHMKWTVGVFGLSVLGLFVTLIGWDLWKLGSSLRFMAWRLGLPVLADYSEGEPSPEAELAQTRNLALRLCQRVSEPGGLVLFTPLTADCRLDALAAELGKYLARHEERVLIIDVALTASSGWRGMLRDLAGDDRISMFHRPEEEAQPRSGVPLTDEASIFDDLLAGRVAGDATIEGIPDVGPAEVLYSASGTRLSPSASLAEISRCGRSGCLDPRQDAGDYIFRTQMPGVDYLPVGHMAALGGVMTLKRLREVVNQMREEYTLILMTGPADTGGVEHEVLGSFAQAVVLAGPEKPGAYAEVARLAESMRVGALPLVGAVIGAPAGAAVAPPAPLMPSSNGSNGVPKWAEKTRPLGGHL